MKDDSITSGGDPAEEPYGLTERQVAFKLLAAHALVDPEFYARLRDDPAGAAQELYIQLRDDDLRYLKGIVEWPILDEHADAVRQALHAEAAVRSIW